MSSLRQACIRAHEGGLEIDDVAVTRRLVSFGISLCGWYHLPPMLSWRLAKTFGKAACHRVKGIHLRNKKLELGRNVSLIGTLFNRCLMNDRLTVRQHVSGHEGAAARP